MLGVVGSGHVQRRSRGRVQDVLGVCAEAAAARTRVRVRSKVSQLNSRYLDQRQCQWCCWRLSCLRGLLVALPSHSSDGSCEGRRPLVCCSGADDRQHVRVAVRAGFGRDDKVHKVRHCNRSSQSCILPRRHEADGLLDACPEPLHRLWHWS